MKKTITLFVVVLATLLSCTETNTLGDNVTLLPETIKTEAIPLKAEIIEFEEPNIYVSEYFVYNDSLLIVCNQYTGKKAVIVYKYPSLEFVADFIPFGKGPGEVGSAFYNLSNENIIVLDPNTRIHSILSIDSLLNKNYKPLFYNHVVFAKNYDEYSKDSLILANPYCFSDEKSGIRNDAERLVVIDKNNKKNQLEVYGKHKYKTSTVSSGDVLTNKDKNRIVFAESDRARLELYDYNLNLDKIIITPQETEIEYVIDSYDKMVLPSVSVIGFTNSYKDEDYFYVSYVGAEYDNQKPGSDYDTWILKFDWDGNFIESYHYNKFIIAFTVSNEKDTFYATLYDEDESYILAKLTKK